MTKVSIIIDCTVCGKEFTHTKYCCNSREAKEYENWACDNITMCPDCYKMKKVEAVEFDDIVSLTGTDRQIEWARIIRAKAIKALMFKADEEKVNEVKALVNAQPSAVWWIDNRDKLKQKEL